MMGGHFYHKRVRTCVAVFGSMFNDSTRFENRLERQGIISSKGSFILCTKEIFHRTSIRDE